MAKSKLNPTTWGPSEFIAVISASIAVIAAVVSGVAWVSEVSVDFAAKHATKQISDVSKEELAKLRTFGIPEGGVVAYTSSAIPSGWLVCDGKAISKVDYPQLFEVIGSTFGGDGAPSFNLPDYRGLFLRGVDSESKNDPDAKERVDSRGATVGPNVGSFQSDLISAHYHDFSDTKKWPNQKEPRLVGWNLGIGFAFDPSGNQGNQNNPNDDRFGLRLGQVPSFNLDKLVSPESNQVIPSGKETRPKNSYVHWIVRATKVEPEANHSSASPTKESAKK